MVTGASSGLGRNIALCFAENGHDLLICGRNMASLKEVKREIEKFKVSCDISCGDLTKTHILEGLFEQASSPPISVVVNNAAMLCNGERLRDMDTSRIDGMIDLNLRVPISIAKGLHHITFATINISSLAALEAKKNRTIYCATKAALKAFSETMLLETEGPLLNVYLSKLKKDPTDYGLNMKNVCVRIYESFKRKEEALIMDGRGN